MSGLLLGVDVGTSSTKGVLVRSDGGIVATARKEHGLSLPRPGWAEYGAEKVWWADFVSVCKELLYKADDGIAAVCTSRPSCRRTRTGTPCGRRSSTA